ncbi:hypothetical protein [Endozoicomonas sp.]|uniref:hypothetical protein n=1 Tax=Endozoicomonas sp. TaxID=1892382 RepID=UPI003AF9A754
MTDQYQFIGNESNGLLLKGSIPAGKAIELAGKDFHFATSNMEGCVRCALMVVQIDDITPWKLRLFKTSYPEAVWLLDFGNGEFMAVKAHTIPRMVNILRLFDNYNTVSGQMALSKEGDRATVNISSKDGRFNVELNGSIPGDTTLINKLWTRNKKGKYYRIPWGTSDCEVISRMNCEVTSGDLGAQVFGDQVVWDNDAVYFTNRTHLCGPSYAQEPL